MDTSTQNILRNKHGEVPKLTADNYYIWSKAIKYNLQAADAWNIVTGNEEPPAAPAANANYHARERYEDKQKNYRIRYNFAASTIYQSCTAPVQAYITDFPSPSDM
ncbi:MAG: hypothetical protein M1839_005698 [Geoglossum umbratile]|nr:MAG: hypothetical protein M1839_005698 [Geoglossum umbratile]